MDKQLILPEGTNVTKMVIALATRISDLLYLSGTAGYDREKGALAGPDIESQARQAIAALTTRPLTGSQASFAILGGYILI